MSLHLTDDEMDDERVAASTIEERVKALREYCQNDWTSSGVVLQASGRRCFTCSLPQEIQNFDTFCAGIRSRGGALDLSLTTDAMLCTVWDAGSVPKRMDMKRGGGPNVAIVRALALVLVLAAIFSIMSFSAKSA